MLLDEDTIVAISTPPGRGGIGVVRFSGARARAIVAPLLRLRQPLAAGRVRLGELLDERGTVLDECVATLFEAPHSYTSEDVVEVATHGSPVLQEYVLRAAVAGGARLAEPGEFTQRAFLNGRLDLTQAEAVDDLIGAQTLHAARVAAAQLGGALARTLAEPKAGLVALIAELEAGVDFAEDDLDLMEPAGIVAALELIRPPLVALAASFAYGRLLREGFTLALVGAPNAGKSSLFNALLERERAIVTAEPGTTRDLVTEGLAIGGVPVRLVDTAGLRDAPVGEAEAMGIARTREAMAEADLVLVVSDGSSGAEAEGLAAGLDGRAYLRVRSKCDLLPAGSEGGWDVATSALTGVGIAELKDAILLELQGPVSVGEDAMLTNLRQHGALVECCEALGRAGDAAQRRLPHELLLLDLYAALGRSIR